MRLFLALLAFVSLLQAEVSPDVHAKFVKVLARHTGYANRVACADPAIAKELEALGVEVDPKSKVAWAGSEAEVISLHEAGKFVICGDLTWLRAGASVAIVEENGKPTTYYHATHMVESKVKLSSALFRIAGIGK